MNLKVRILIGLVITGLISGAVYWWHLSNKNIGAGTELVFYGNVDIREVHLAFNGSEHVSKILVDEGDRVQAGQLLASLHTERLQAALDQASTDADALRAESKSATLSYQRIKSLASRKMASTDEADVAKAKSLAAQAYVTAAEAVRTVAEQALKDAQLYAR